MIIPSPMAAPSIPTPRARLSGVVVSATNAIAVGSVADETAPANVRMAMNWNRVCDRPWAINEKANPAMPISSTGLRPTRSETRPHMGAKTNCISEYSAIISPRVAPEALKWVI